MLMAKPLYLLLVSMIKTQSNLQDEVDDEVESWVLVNGDEELAAAQEMNNMDLDRDNGNY